MQSNAMLVFVSLLSGVAFIGGYETAGENYMVMGPTTLKIKQSAVAVGKVAYLNCTVNCGLMNEACPGDECINKVDFFFKEQTNKIQEDASKYVVRESPPVSTPGVRQCPVFNVILEIHRLNLEDGGVYYCSRRDQQKRSQPAVLLVHSKMSVRSAVAVTRNETKRLSLGSSTSTVFSVTTLDHSFGARLHCSVQITEWINGDQLTMTWKKASNPIQKVDCMKKRNLDCTFESGVKNVGDTNFTASLGFTYVMPSDIGKYTCHVNLGSMEFTQSEVHLESKPLVDVIPDTPETANFDEVKEDTVRPTEGTDFRLMCRVRAWPLPESSVTWEALPAEFHSRGDVRRGSRLAFEKVAMRDRAFYFCTASNVHGRSRNGIVLRVRDGMAAVWPSIGIALELVILLIIIIVYERKKSRGKDNERRRSTGHVLVPNDDEGGTDGPLASGSRSLDCSPAVRQRV